MPLCITYDDNGNKILNGRYVKVENLNEGRNSKVKLYRTIFNDGCNNIQVAVKIFHLRRSLANRSLFFNDENGDLQKRTTISQGENEIYILRKLEPHPNICPLLDSMNSEDGFRLYLCYLYLGGGPLMHLDIHCNEYWNQKTGNVMDVDTMSKYCMDLASAISYIHGKGIIHRDINPTNILLSAAGERAFLSDFGVAYETGPTGQVDGTEGTYAYYSPEMCDYEETYDGFAADMWALGITCYACIFGRVPFFSPVVTDLFDKIQNAKIEHAIPDNEEILGDLCRLEKKSILVNARYPGIRSFFKKILAQNASERIKVQELQDTIKELQLKCQ